MSDLLSPLENAFRECCSSLDVLTDSYRSMVGGTQYPFTYEADMAATHPIACGWLHANAFSKITELPYCGSHLIPAECLARAADEAGITALWLLEPDDWRLRESRWLRWDRRELAHERKLVKTLSESGFGIASSFESASHAAEVRRQKIRVLLDAKFSNDCIAPPKGPVPSFEQIVKDLKMPAVAYIYYRLLSHSTHSGPSVARSALSQSGNQIGFYMSHSPRDWVNGFKIIGTAITAPGLVQARRINVETARIAEFQGAWESLKVRGERLRTSQNAAGGGH